MSALDGDITVDSDLGAGATFRFSLPLARADRDERGTPAVAPAPWPPLRRTAN